MQLNPAIAGARGAREMQLLLLTVAIAAAVYAKAALGPLLETMRTALELTDNQLAVLQGPALAVPMLLLAIPLGLAVDRYSRIRIVLALEVLLLIGSLLTVTASGFALLAAARCIVGLAAFGINPAVLSLMADLYPPSERGRAGMVMLIGQFAGWAVVFAIGGKLVMTPGWGSDAWRWALFWLTVPAMLAVILLMLALREPPRSEAGAIRPRPRESFASCWSLRGVIGPLFAGKILVLLSLASTMAWAAPALARAFGLQPDRVGAIVGTAVPLGGIVGTIAGGLLADWAHRRGGPFLTTLTAAGMALLAAPLSLFPLAGHPTMASAMLGLSLASLTASSVIIATLLIVVIPNEIRGLVIGALTGAGAFLSVGLGPLLVSWTSAGMDGSSSLGAALALVCGICSAAAAAVLALGRHRFARVHAP